MTLMNESHISSSVYYIAVISLKVNVLILNEFIKRFIFLTYFGKLMTRNYFILKLLYFHRKLMHRQNARKRRSSRSL